MDYETIPESSAHEQKSPLLDPLLVTGVQEAPLDFDKIDIAAFCDDIEKIKHETFNSLNREDFDHLLRVEKRGRLATVAGYATAWICPNPFSAFLLSLGQFIRWMVAHHVIHRGYDRIPGVPVRYTSKKFALGWRRYVDWFDWIVPESWAHEHNFLHHYHTGEHDDPDVVERHAEFLRRMNLPKPVKVFVVFLAGISWKWSYYAPSTLSTLDPSDNRRLRKEEISFIEWYQIFDLNRAHVRWVWGRCYIPYGLFNFVLVPLLYSPLGRTAVIFVFINKIIAECMTNLHGFMTIVPNHTGDDLYRYKFHFQNKAEFYLSQVLGSVNFHAGGEFTNFMSGWLNYQIEHHLFPDLPMSKYPEVQGKVRAVCLKHNVPYRQESVWARCIRMVNICIGETTMRQLENFPPLRTH